MRAASVRVRLCMFLALLAGLLYLCLTLTSITVAGGHYGAPSNDMEEVKRAFKSAEIPADRNQVSQNAVAVAPIASAVGSSDTSTNSETSGPLKKPRLVTTNDTLAKVLDKQIRVLCWIAVTNSTMDRATVILETWGRRCTKILLIGDESTRGMNNVVELQVKEGRQRLWPKTREAFRYLYANHLDEADWFLKADTDTYVIMENLRLLLSQQKAEEPAYIGCTIQLYTPQGYNSGGAGYLLNKASLKKLVTEAFKDRRCEQGYMEDEDVSLGHCMGVVGIKPTDPTDDFGKNRFFPFEPADHINHEPMKGNIWYWRSTFKPGPKSMDCCSETVISFHYVSTQLMWNMEFLLYHAKVYGISTWFDMT